METGHVTLFLALQDSGFAKVEHPRTPSTADVLGHYALRNILMRLADHGMIVPYWTPAILDEMRRDLLREYPGLKNFRLERCIRLMRDMFPEADIIDYEVNLERIPKHIPDRDVLAAAQAARVDAIVTTKLRRFPP